MKQCPQIQFDRSCNRYYVRLQVEGTRKRFWLGQSKRDAPAKLKELLKKISAGQVAFSETETTVMKTSDGGNDMRLGELAHKYLEWVSENRSESTYETRLVSIQAFIGFIGPCMVSQITRARLMEFYVWARKTHGYGANRGNHLCRDMRTMFRWAEENEICDCPVRRFPPISESPPKTKVFNDEEITLLLNHITDDEFRDMLVFGLLTGLRPQELRCLRWSEVKQDANHKYYVFIEQHKTAKMTTVPMVRSVPLSDDAVTIIHQQEQRHPKSELVFLNNDGTPYTSHAFRRRLTRACTRAKIPNRPPYALRHKFASMHAEDGTNIVTLGQLMGHTNTRTTARYITATAAHHRLLVEKTASHVSSLLPKAVEPEEEQKMASNQ
jgi:integrase